ncbi:hypothetical protein TNCV_2261921 [Trichonephila clavipes]|nr:hypothetical protein TNCV_2261921 [Trichonephila clavipes]
MSFLVLSEGNTRNRWRDGQVCPDVGQGTMAPWARRPRRKERRKRREKGEEKSRERGAGLGWRKGLSPRLEVKPDERQGP